MGGVRADHRATAGDTSLRRRRCPPAAGRPRLLLPRPLGAGGLEGEGRTRAAGQPPARRLRADQAAAVGGGGHEPLLPPAPAHRGRPARPADRGGGPGRDHAPAGRAALGAPPPLLVADLAGPALRHPADASRALPRAPGLVQGGHGGPAHEQGPARARAPGYASLRPAARLADRSHRAGPVPAVRPVRGRGGWLPGRELGGVRRAHGLHRQPVPRPPADPSPLRAAARHRPAGGPAGHRPQRARRLAPGRRPRGRRRGQAVLRRVQARPDGVPERSGAAGGPGGLGRGHGGQGPGRLSRRQPRAPAVGGRRPVATGPGLLPGVLARGRVVAVLGIAPHELHRRQGRPGVDDHRQARVATAPAPGPDRPDAPRRHGGRARRPGPAPTGPAHARLSRRPGGAAVPRRGAALAHEELGRRVGQAAARRAHQPGGPARHPPRVHHLRAPVAGEARRPLRRGGPERVRPPVAGARIPPRCRLRAPLHGQERSR